MLHRSLWLYWQGFPFHRWLRLRRDHVVGHPNPEDPEHLVRLDGVGIRGIAVGAFSHPLETEAHQPVPNVTDDQMLFLVRRLLVIREVLRAHD